jgi:hypothetical protein
MSVDGYIINEGRNVLNVDTCGHYDVDVKNLTKRMKERPEREEDTGSKDGKDHASLAAWQPDLPEHAQGKHNEYQDCNAISYHGY